MTTCESLRTSHVQFLETRVDCREQGERIWLMSPYTRLDGDAVEVFARDQDDGTVAVSDLGETLRHLASFGYDPRETVNGRYLLTQIAKQYRVDVDPAGIIYKVIRPDDLGEATHELVTASLSIGNLIFLARAVRPATIHEEVSQFLKAADVAFRENAKVSGRTGKPYTVDFLLTGTKGEGVVKAISASTTSGATGGLNATFRALYDIDASWKATVIDDRVRSWREEDLALLRGIGQVFRWSEDQEAFTDALGDFAIATNRA